MAFDIRYCTTGDGVRIAYGVEGEGTPLLWIPGWVSHLEFDYPLFDMAGLRPMLDGIQWIQLDKRGTGLSARDLDDYSLEARTRDIEAVVSDLGLDRFAVGGISEGGPLALFYAAHHPEKVSKLVIMGSFARGDGLAGSQEMREAVIAVARAEWGMASKFLAELFCGADSILDMDGFALYQRTAGNARDAVLILQAVLDIDATPLLGRITAPTLVIHARDDRIVPINLGQEVAAGIKGARFVSIPGAHIPGVEGFQQAHTAIHDFIVETPAKGAPSDAVGGFRTILFTDLVGHTSMMRRLGDDKGRGVLREHESITRNVLKQHGGSEVKTMGDGFMASFPSVTRAVECALALQQAFEQRNAGSTAVGAQQLTTDAPETEGASRSAAPETPTPGPTSPEPLHVRVGLNAGEPIEEDGDLFGEMVILAARIAAMAQGGEVLASMAVRELCAGKGFLFADLGEHAMRGFEDPVRVFEIKR
jgi:class 3 adenylate cyclase/pimeloyl-ACP methyl ester carboxylesterase